MEKYKIIEHRADLKIKVFGKTKEELFENAVLAMNDYLQPEIKNSKIIKRKILIKSFDIKTLIVDFLSEILYLIQTKKETYFKTDFKKFNDTEINAFIFGRKVKKFNEDIKAVTYYDLEIKQKEKNLWQATILFDI
jgi:SHS2 domain-containing protein